MQYVEKYKKNNNIIKNDKQNQEKKEQEKQVQDKQYIDNMFDKIDKNIKLDDEQKKIVLSDEDNIMVIAGAGSGKTTTISAKVHYLIEKQKIKDNEILIISYTNKAINELKERINTDFKHNVKIMTFHKFAYEIIKTDSKEPPRINNKNSEIIKEFLNNKKIKKKYKNKKTEELIRICTQFIKLYKSKGYTEKDINIIKQKRQKRLTNLIKEAYIYYQTRLKQNNEIDFEDIINKAIQIIQTTKKTNLKYKYIIIDEYQDISENRNKLIQLISEKIHNKIMVVGDDWQCIYSFASSNIKLFINYKKNIKNSAILKITKTYRNSQELINIAGKFIQKNKIQIQKDLTSNKKLEKPLTILKYRKNCMPQKIEQSIEYLIQKYGETKNILILGRYTFDKKNILNNNIIENHNTITYIKHNKTVIKYMTIHASKGLGYDNVIIITTANKKMGFPSRIKTEKIIKQLQQEKEPIKYAEERRLFYVALTRTKNEIIILSPSNKMSAFVKEIKKDKNVQIKSNISLVKNIK